ncbi:hypothetical protein ACO2Q8_26535 [Larkinella sp. VNQ87]|uniref:hypothetical protein n=1 Tax=Larkinella sp. VNQ87 TaxID=3400921 RepID=UPI003C07F0DF
MEPLTHYAERLNHLPVDLRAEVVLADMLEDGISPDALILNPVGGFKRAFGRDLARTEWVESQQSARRWLQIDLNRNGLYDLLPEGIAHQPTSNQTAVSTEALLLEMQLQQEREQAARRFFRPIEQEFFRQRIRIEQEQRRFPFDSEPRPDDLLGQFWDVPDFLTPAQFQRLMYLLPVMHRMAGDWSAVRSCFEEVIEEPIHLEIIPPGLTNVAVDTAPLGDWQLGTNSVFDGWLSDEEPKVRITVRINQAGRIAAYRPGGNGLRLLEWLAGYLIPLDVGLRIDLDTSELPDAFLFTSDDHAGRLDFTTCL